MIAACEWSPATDVYKGTAETAIYAFVDIPLTVRKALIERTKKASGFDDIVTISRDSLTGSFRYAPEIASMHFGSKGRMCAAVSRLKWRDSQTQSGMVYCESGYCVIRPSVCNNWAVIRRVAEPPRVLPPTETVETLDSPAETVPVQPVSLGSHEPSAGTFEAGTGSAPFEPSGYLTGWISAPVAVYSSVTLPTVPAIPEPAPLWLILAGLGGVALWRKLNKS